MIPGMKFKRFCRCLSAALLINGFPWRGTLTLRDRFREDRLA
jgi:hypothetical protein